MNTATHPFAPEEIMAFLDGEFSAGRARDVAQHMEQCVDCCLVSNAIKEVSQRIVAWDVKPPQKLNEQIVASMAEKLASRSELAEAVSWLREKMSRKWVWASAVSFVIFLLGFGLLLPDFFVMHRLAAPMNAVVTQSGDSVDFGRSTQSSGPGRGGNGTLGKLQTEQMDRLPKTGLAIVPMITRSASIAVLVQDFGAARLSVDAILTRHDGYAANLSISNQAGAARSLQASVRVPAGQLQAALADLRALGRVETESQNGEEVTQQHADLVARLRNSRETEQRLQDVLRTRTGKMSDILEVEQEIARVRGEIEQMEAEQKALEHRVNFATIELKITEEYKAQLSSPAPSVSTQLHNAAVNGFRSALESLLAIVLFLAEAGPTLLLWLMVLFLPAFWLWRRFRRALHPAISQ